MQPNLFIVGAMKSGTSSLHHYLSEHPEIFMCEPKEPGQFVPEVAQGRSLDAYLEMFSGAGDAKWCGESSTHYAKFPMHTGVPERVFQFSPDARIIYLMRDPVERAISHYWHMVRWYGEKRLPLVAVKTDPTFVDLSNYPLQIGQYRHFFADDCIWIDSFERLMSDTAEFCSRVFAWLQVETEFRPPSITDVYNKTPKEVTRREATWIRRFRHSKFWTMVGPHVPSRLRKRALTAAQDQIDREDPAVKKQLSDARCYLRDVLAPTVERLREMLARDFDEWSNFPLSAKVSQ